MWKITFCTPSRKILQPNTFWYIILGHPDKPGLHGKNAATQQLKPLEFAQCLLTGSLLQGNLFLRALTTVPVRFGLLLTYRLEGYWQQFQQQLFFILTQNIKEA